MPLSIRAFITLILLLTLYSVSSSAQSSSPGTVSFARADLDLAVGRVCFPVALPQTAQQYDICLKVEKLSPQIVLSLISASPSAVEYQNIPVYTQQGGLNIPLVSLADGRFFADASLAVSFNTLTGAYSFTVTGARKVHYEQGVSVARQWNEALLDSIRKDFARPTVHARNLFHTSIAMYDAWAAYDTIADTYLLGKTVEGFSCDYSGLPSSSDIVADRQTAISYATYRLLRHRFANSPGAAKALQRYDDLMAILELDRNYTSTDYTGGNAAALGNYIAQCVIAFGLQDGANEANAYANLQYEPINEPLAPEQSGNKTLGNPDRWQPLSFELFRDQSGNLFSGNTPEFVSPEWGQVVPFALQSQDLEIKQRDGKQWWVYHDPGAPPLLSDAQTADEYKYGFELVSIWSSHLDPSDDVLWDISPASIGNIQDYPETLSQYHQFYNQFGGGDTSVGHEINPVTGQPYESQLVPRADYARVLAEFWADGPDSETPPGHWFTILNYVSDHPQFEKRLKGQGPVVDELEWDVKAYFAMGGAMHDSAITAWGIKGYYDYVRPVSAIRYMAELGQSTDSTAANYHPDGIELINGFIETVQEGDALSGTNNVNVGKIKLYAWRGPDFIANEATDDAGVGWILAENWWPYQRPSFVTPPFAGYISGHSTYSRAAAELMTLLTGDEFFPGGMGEFLAEKNKFLVFEEGPSVDVILQWATYRDASDQTSLSRIWGGIHPPADDIPGRRLGAIIGVDAFVKAEQYFSGDAD